jgi:hypothetical protein
MDISGSMNLVSVSCGLPRRVYDGLLENSVHIGEQFAVVPRKTR